MIITTFARQLILSHFVSKRPAQVNKEDREDCKQTQRTRVLEYFICMENYSGIEYFTIFLFCHTGKWSVSVNVFLCRPIYLGTNSTQNDDGHLNVGLHVNVDLNYTMFSTMFQDQLLRELRFIVLCCISIFHFYELNCKLYFVILFSYMHNFVT
jgi:hypothetical protein